MEDRIMGWCVFIFVVAIVLMIIGVIMTVNGLKEGNVVSFVIGVNLFLMSVAGAANILDSMSRFRAEAAAAEAEEIGDETGLETTDETDYFEASDAENAELAY